MDGTRPRGGIAELRRWEVVSNGVVREADRSTGGAERAYLHPMAWIKVPPEHHPLFRAALPRDPRVELQPMFGGLAARVNGHVFAGLFGRSTMLWLPEPDRAEALALEGASVFDPMGDGRARSDKVMLPEQMMDEADELRAWIARAFQGTLVLPPKAAKVAKKKATPAKAKTTKVVPAKTKRAPKR